MSVAMNEKSAIIRLLRAGSEYNCNFWLGCFRAGDTLTSELLALANPDEVFAVAATAGLLESESVLLADARAPMPRYFYLAPANMEAVTDYANVLKQWQPVQVGICFDANLVGNEDARFMTLDIVHNALLNTSVREFALLAGDSDYGRLLNTSVWLRETLENESFNVCLYH
ncbi:MAG: hypothetical protein OYH77_05825 [Pseudomonadota bacterium]|nr:hypothetical protein [Pseudomonadota bacterium]